MINSFLLVGAGGAIGSMLRFGTAQLISAKWFPFATLTVNILGSVFIGVLLGLSLKNHITNNAWKFLAIGICGGFTTFSAYTLESFQLLQQQRYLVFLVYFTGSIIVGLAATYAGYLFAK